MASTSNFTLTTEEQAIFDAAFKNSIFPESSDENFQLFNEWKAKEKALEATKLLPYADIFYQILKHIFLARKDEILTNLQNKIKTMTTRHSSHVTLFRFNSVEWYESLSEKKQRQSLMTYDERMKESDADMENYNKIKTNNWDWTLGTMSTYGSGNEENLYPFRPQVRLMRLINKTPILKWLSGLIGPNYECFVESKYLATQFPGQNFYILQNTIRIRYLPYGQKNKHMLLKIANCCNEKNARISYTLSENEVLYGNGGWYLPSLTHMLKD